MESLHCAPYEAVQRLANMLGSPVSTFLYTVALNWRPMTPCDEPGVARASTAIGGVTSTVNAERAEEVGTSSGRARVRERTLG